MNNKTIFVVNDQISNPTYAPHLADAIFQCIVLKTQGIYHYGSDDYLSRYQFAVLIAECFKLDKDLIETIETKELTQNIPSYIARRPKNTGLKTLKIEDELSIPAYSTYHSLNTIKNILS